MSMDCLSDRAPCCSPVLLQHPEITIPKSQNSRFQRLQSQNSRSQDSFKKNWRTLMSRVAEVAREHGWHPPKCLDSDENFKPQHTLFCRELRFVAIYAFFGDLWAKKVPFCVKNSVSWARCALLHGMYCLFH